jgi:hypothetical protein
MQSLIFVICKFIFTALYCWFCSFVGILASLVTHTKTRIGAWHVVRIANIFVASTYCKLEKCLRCWISGHQNGFQASIHFLPTAINWLRSFNKPALIAAEVNEI